MKPAPVAISRLTLTIVLANLIGLVILLVGSLGVTQYRDGLIQAKLEGVRAQAQLFADVLAQAAVSGSDCAPARSFGDESVICRPTLSEADVNQVFNRVWDSFEGRVRIFNAPQSTDDAVVTGRERAADDVMLREDQIVVEELAPVDDASADNIF